MSVSPTTAKPVEATKEILSGYPDTAWTNDTPTVRFNWDIAFSDKGPGQGQPPEIYVWSPVDATLDKLTSDGTFLDENHTVEIQCWSLDPTESLQTARDVVQIFGDYLDTNQTNDFIEKRPESLSDVRAESQARRTEHYVSEVQINSRKLTDSGTTQGSTFDATFDAGFA